MKTTIIALSAAALMAAAPVVLAQGVPGKIPGQQSHFSKKHHAGHTPPREMQAQGSKKRYPEAFGYAPKEVLDKEIEASRTAGGGGGGGGGGGSGM